MHGGARRKLNMKSSLRRQVLRNLTTDLLKHGRIETTMPRAKELRRLADKMITLGKCGTENARRQIEAYIYQPKAVVPLLMNTYAKRFADRPGGFTRIIPIGSREGDRAPMAMIEVLNTDNPEAEMGFSYLVRSLANMQIQGETKIVANALEPTIDPNAVYADKRQFKKALAEQKAKEKFALKVKKAITNAKISPERLQEIVDNDSVRAQKRADRQASKKIYCTVKEIWPENTPTLE